MSCAISLPAMRSIIAIVPAAGASARMRLGQSAPASKTLLDIGGRTVLERTVAAIADTPDLKAIIVAVPAGSVDQFSADHSAALSESCGAALEAAGISLAFCAGGATRQASVFEALRYIDEHFLELLAGDVRVLVHDAARCFVSAQLITRAVAAAWEHPAVIAALPCVDTVKRVSAEGLVIGSVDRAGLWNVQTPQIFSFELLKKGHLLAQEAEESSATDDSSLVEKIHPVQVVEGERQNIKITTPEDLTIARAICR